MLFRSDKDPGVRLCAMVGLAGIKDPQALKSVMRAFNKEESALIRIYALVSAFSVAEASAVPYGIEIMRDKGQDLFMRLHAAKLIVSFGGRPGMKALIKELATQDETVLVVAMTALAGYPSTNDFFMSAEARAMSEDYTSGMRSIYVMIEIGRAHV